MSKPPLNNFVSNFVSKTLSTNKFFFHFYVDNCAVLSCLSHNWIFYPLDLDTST